MKCKKSHSVPMQKHQLAFYCYIMSPFALIVCISVVCSGCEQCVITYTLCSADCSICCIVVHSEGLKGTSLCDQMLSIIAVLLSVQNLYL